MATSTKRSLAAAVAVLVLLVAAVAPANGRGIGSTLTLFKEQGCTGDNGSYWDCTCHNITYTGGYDYYDATGDCLIFYSETDCESGSESTIICKSDEQCTGITHKSFKIICSKSFRGVLKLAAAN